MTGPRRLVVRSARVVDPDTPSRLADVVVEDRVVADIVGAGAAAIDGDTTVIDGSDHLLLPGAINSHTHSGQHLDRGVAPPLPLDHWLMWVVHGGLELGPEEAHTLAIAGAIEMLESGCTAVLDQVWVPPGEVAAHTDSIMDAYAEVGLRAVVAPMVQDRDILESLLLAPDRPRPAPLTDAVPAEDLAAEVETFVTTWLGARHGLVPAIGPSAPQRCSDELLTRLASIRRRHDVPFHTHVLETRDQVVATRRRYGRSVVAHLDDLDLLGSWASLAHGVWMDADEFSTVQERSATIVHNPVSNLRCGSGLLPLAGLLEGGVSVALGADGAASNDAQNMFEVMKIAALIQTMSGAHRSWPDAVDVWRACLHGGARALVQPTGAPGGLGTIRPGAAADLVLVDDARHPLDHEEALIRSLVLAERGDGVRTVIVGGRVVVESGRVTSVDRRAAMRRSRQLQQRIHAEATERATFYERHRELLDAAHLHATSLPCPVERRARITPAFEVPHTLAPHHRAHLGPEGGV